MLLPSVKASILDILLSTPLFVHVDLPSPLYRLLFQSNSVCIACNKLWFTASLHDSGSYGRL